MQKVERDGKVAVLVSPGYGAGWSTWASDTEAAQEMMFSKEIIEAILGGLREEALARKAKEVFPDEYCGGVTDCVVKWVEKGAVLLITEYDGYEKLEIISHLTACTA